MRITYLVVCIKVIVYFWWGKQTDKMNNEEILEQIYAVLVLKNSDLLFKFLNQALSQKISTKFSLQDLSHCWIASCFFRQFFCRSTFEAKKAASPRLIRARERN